MKTIASTLPLIALANEKPVQPYAEHERGVIMLANESRLVGATHSESLTQFSVGYKDPENLMDLADFIAPPVPVSRRFDFKKTDASKDFMTEQDDERAIGAAFKRVEYAGTETQSKTRNRGLCYVLDTDEDGGSTTEEQVVAMLIQRIARNKYRRAVAALAALSAGSGAVFSASTAPDELMKAALATAQEATGVFPNRGLMGLPAWNLRSAGMAASDKAGAFAGLSQTPAQVAGSLMLDDLRIDKSLYQSSATAKSRIVTSQFFGFRARNGLMKDDDSNLKQFYTPTGGGRFRVHRKVTGPADKFIEITVEHYEIIVATSTLGVARLNITNA
ncbi:MAG TPA: hypothetical protein VGE76_16340 [Opitutaceae bacterium]